MERKLKDKTCRAAECDEKFTPRNSTQVACSYPCALELVKQKKVKAFKAETREMRKKFNENDRSYHVKRAQAACNQYIRERDRRLPCISCGIKTGQFQAGHLYSVGHAPEIRYHPDNIFGQCAQCNGSKSGNSAEMFVGAEKRIGRDRLENLALCRTPQNLTIEDLKDIREWYIYQYKWLIEHP